MIDKSGGLDNLGLSLLPEICPEISVIFAGGNAVVIVNSKTNLRLAQLRTLHVEIMFSTFFRRVNVA